MRWLCTVILVVLLSVATAGCSVFQPHIDAPPEAPDMGAMPSARLAAQIARAKELQQRYLDAVSEQSAAANGLAMTLIPLSAASLAVGIANPGTAFTRNFLIGAGASAAALFGTGTILIDRKRDAVYYAGAKSLYCLRLAIGPLEVSDADLTQIDSDVEDLRLRIGEAAASGVDRALLDQANTVFASGRALVNDIRDASVKFSLEIDKININVNAEIAKTEPDLTQIINTAASLQKYATTIIPNVPTGKAPGASQSLRLTPRLSNAEADLRRSIGLVSAWMAAYQSAVAATAAKMRAENCTLIPPAGLASEVPTIIVTGNQPVTVTSGPVGGSTVIAPPPVMTLPPVLPAPPPVARSPSPPINVDPNDPIVDLSDSRKNSLFWQVAERFGLHWPGISTFKSDVFVSAVKSFQMCIKEPVTGRITASQLKKILEVTDARKCPIEGSKTGAATPIAPAPETSPGISNPPAATTPSTPTPDKSEKSPGPATPLLPSPPDLGHP
jgi:hypothetical protein